MKQLDKIVSCWMLVAGIGVFILLFFLLWIFEIFRNKALKISYSASQLWVPIPGAVCDSRISQKKRVYCCFPQSLWHRCRGIWCRRLYKTHSAADVERFLFSCTHWPAPVFSSRPADSHISVCLSLHQQWTALFPGPKKLSIQPQMGWKWNGQKSKVSESIVIFYRSEHFVDLVQGLANYCPQAESCPVPVFINKYLLKHSHTHFLFSVVVFML